MPMVNPVELPTERKCALELESLFLEHSGHGLAHC